MLVRLWIDTLINKHSVGVDKMDGMYSLVEQSFLGQIQNSMSLFVEVPNTKYRPHMIIH